ncbi:MAG: insulinase family protein [candidate division SR1 bacterium]|nr:insulinase family protein [candidate division SR1 bacterium]
MSAKDFFKLIKQTTITEYSSELKLYIHIKSGTTVLFMENDDTNKVFGVSFRTPVSDSTGVPHILEHSVLNGSQNYPLKEPFVNLVKSSLNTFLNAFTYPDRTVYPVASQNKKDLYNLAKVYMDAVLFPKLLPETFKQEGWHYEIEGTDNPVTYKGVVFNEMKGVYSNPDSIYTDYIMNALNPNNTYSHDSGGNPAKIPSLSYENFVNFHKTFYHPSNSLIYVYGDDTSDDRFDLINEYLNQFDKIDVDSTIHTQDILPRLAHKVEYFDPGDSSLDKGYVSTSWLFSKKENSLPYYILDKILTGSPTAPIYKSLVDSKLGEDTAPFFGFELDLVQPMISYGLKGVIESDQSKVIELVYSTLDNIVTNGINPKDIEAAINSTEFQLREYETGSYPKGLAMMLDILVDWVYDRDFMNTLSFEKDLLELKQELQSNPRYFEDMIQKELIENTHRLDFIYLPKKGLLDDIAAEETKELDSYKQSLSISKLNELVLETQKLKEFQNIKDTPEQLAMLPKLTFEDLKGDPEIIPSIKNSVQDVPVYYHNIHTNGVAYIDIGFDLDAIDAKYYPYLALYSRLFTELNTTHYTANDINQLLDLHTGNFSSKVINMEKVDGESVVRYLFLRGKVLPRSIASLLEIWSEIIQTLKLDNKDKIKQILIDLKSTLESNIVSDGRVYGTMAINSLVSRSGDFDEITSGYRYLQWLQETILRVETNWQEVLNDLFYIQNNLFIKNSLVVNITVESKDLNTLEKPIFDFISTFRQGFINKSSILSSKYKDKTVFVIPTKVNYVCYGVNLKTAFSGVIGGQLDVVLNHLNYDYLWSKIRAQGGAYGSRATLDKLSGVVNFWSYRDPRFEGTIKDYAKIGEYLQDLKIDKNDILNSVIGSIGKFDSYMAPRDKGWVSLIRTLTGRTYEELSQIRKQILDVSIDDFHKLGNILSTSFKDGKWAIFSSQSSFDEIANKSSYEVIKPLS